MKRLLTGALFCGLVAACASGRSTSPGGDEATPTPTATPTSTPEATPTPSGCVAGGLAAGDHDVECDGLTYAVRIPAACPAGGCGLILDVHGLTMSAAMQDTNTGMRARGEANGYVVVQPNAPGNPPTSSWSALEYPKVYAFVLDALTLGIDADRVHVTGFSQGGAMTFAMMCRWPETFASAAPGAAAGGDCFDLGGTPPSIERPMLQIHGSADSLVPFSAAEAQRDSVVSAFALGAPVNAGAGVGWIRTRYENSGSGITLDFLQHDYSAGGLINGHCYPGSTDPGGAPGQLFSFACTPPNGFIYGEEVMEFFLANPRQR